MKTLTITTTLLLATMALARAEQQSTLEPTLQQEMRAHARLAVEQAQLMERLAARSSKDSRRQWMHTAELRDAINEALNSAVKMTLAIPAESFNTAAVNQLLQVSSRLAATTEAATKYLNESPHKPQAAEYQALLKQVLETCSELAD